MIGPGKREEGTMRNTLIRHMLTEGGKEFHKNSGPYNLDEISRGSMACTCSDISVKVKGNLLYQILPITKEGTECLWILEATDSLFRFITPTHLPGNLKVCSLLVLLLFLSGLRKEKIR